MRPVQKTALLGLWISIALLIFSISTGSLILAVLAIAFGFSIAVPAALLALGISSGLPSLNWSKLKRHIPVKLPSVSVKNESSESLRLAAPSPQAERVLEIIPKQVAEPVPATLQPPSSQAIPIPVHVHHAPPAPEPIPEPEPLATPLQLGLSQAERQHVIEAIEEKSAIDDIAEYASHEDALVRLYAIQRLGNLGDTQAASTLQAALDDDQDIIKRAARIALQKLDKPTDH